MEFNASWDIRQPWRLISSISASMMTSSLLGANLLQNPANPEQNLNPSAAITAAIYATRVCGNGIIALDTISNLATGSPNGTTPSGTPVTGAAKQVCNQAFGGTTREFTTYPGAGVIADALQVRIKHATTNGFTGAIAYTWGKMKNSTNGAFSYPNKPFKPGIQQEWANGTDDQRHTLTVNGRISVEVWACRFRAFITTGRAWRSRPVLRHYGQRLHREHSYLCRRRNSDRIRFSGICPTVSVCVATHRCPRSSMIPDTATRSFNGMDSGGAIITAWIRACRRPSRSRSVTTQLSL